MIIGKVVGSLFSTRKSEKLVGNKFMIVEPVESMRNTGSRLVAIDIIGAGIGEYVLVAQGSAARIGCDMADAPIDAAIVGIIDEGQDLLTDTYLECIDRIVRDGLGDGSWAIYYDPNQNIFNSYAQLDAMIKKLRKEAYAMSWKLHANCRNTKQIANANILMTNIPNQGKPTVSGPQVEYGSYTEKMMNGKKSMRLSGKLRTAVRLAAIL